MAQLAGWLEDVTASGSGSGSVEQLSAAAASTASGLL